MGAAIPGRGPEWTPVVSHWKEHNGAHASIKVSERRRTATFVGTD